MIKEMTDTVDADKYKVDSIDTPDCFGEYSKKNRLCNHYCAVALTCCIYKGKNPKLDVIERLLIQNQYAVKLN